MSGGDFGPPIAMLIVAAILGFVAYLFMIKQEVAEYHLSNATGNKVSL
ncbi:hypothetical protein [Peribacillus simplex]